MSLVRRKTNRMQSLGGAGGGSSAWTGLTDTPGSLTANQTVRANAGATALEFYTPSGTGDILADGSIPMTANWDIGAFTITGTRFISDIATGTAPFGCSSTTVVTNLNADTVDGVHAAALLRVDGSLGLSADWDAGTFEIRANTLESDVATGTAPLTIASTTLVSNLNADLVDGVEAAALLRVDGSLALSANWDVGAFTITGTQFISDIVTGTAPLVVSSTTVVTNLNADTLDGVHAAAMLRVDGSLGLSADWDAGTFEIRANTFESDVATGTAPLVIASTTLCANLNADLLDGVEAAALLRVDGSLALSANWDVGAFTITGTQFISDIAIGTAPLVVTSTTVVTNLNADQVDGEDAAALHAAASLTGTVAMARLHTDILTDTKSFNVADPDGVTVLGLWKEGHANGITITEISGWTDTGTVDFNIEKRAEATPNTAGTNLMSSDLQATTTQAEGTLIGSPTIDLNQQVVYAPSATASTPGFVTVTIRYTIDTS